MLREFPEEYGVSADELEEPDEESVVSVLGKEHGDVEQYTEEEQKHFDAYRRRFQLRSKPAAHIEAMAKLDASDLQDDIPASIERLLAMVKEKLEELPE